jgi:hypothetical protein
MFGSYNSVIIFVLNKQSKFAKCNKIFQITNKQITNKVMTKKLENKKIRPVLLKMEKYQTEEWPIERTDVVRATVYRLQPQLKKRWATKQVGDILSVTRIA